MLVKNFKRESKLLETIELFLDGYYHREAGLLEAPFEHVKGLWKNKFGITPPPKWQYDRAIRRLAQNERVKLIKKNGQTFIQLTQKGKIDVLLKKLEHGQTKNWDGKWRLMIWDIPETSRQKRDQIRWFIKRLHFFLLQKSVFITPYEMSKDTVDYLVESGLMDYIRFLRVDRLDNDQAMKKHFGLK